MSSMKSIILTLFVASGIAVVRDNGQYGHVAPEIRQWFRELLTPDGAVVCCDLSDCLPTEAYISADKWQARAPDGRWVTVPSGRVVTHRGNPIGEPILCAIPAGDGSYVVLCFVPGALL
jgi:hypothetical protein